MNNLNAFQSFAKKNKQNKIRNNKAVIYTRVSDIKQQDNTSLESQRTYCTDYALKKGLDICAYFGGTYESAKTDDRKEYKKMLKYVRQHKISNIVVFSDDRFSRTGGQAINTIENLNLKGINVLSVTQPVDTETSTGMFFKKLNLLFSKYDNDQRREKTVTGMRQRLLKGYWIGTAPLGYKNSRNKQNVPIIEPNEKAKYIKMAFEWKANENLANVEIVQRLKTRGLRIYKQRLTEIFRNPVYCGLISHSLLDGKVIEGKHEPIVEKGLFLKVHGIQSENNHAYKHQKINDHLPLKGFTRCKNCKSPLTGYIVKKKDLYYYKCKTVGCSCNKSAKALHKQFTELLGHYTIEEKYIAVIRQQLAYTFEYFNQTNDNELAQLRYTLKSTQSNLETVQERYALGKIESKHFIKFSRKYEKEIDKIEQEIQKITHVSSNLESYINKSLKLFQNLNEIWSSACYIEKQKMQKVLFPGGIEYDRKNDVVRTIEVNMFMATTASFSGDLTNKKSEQIQPDVDLSALVIAAGFEPATVCLEGGNKLNQFRD